MRQIKFHNKTVSIGRCQIGVVVSNIAETWFGHIVGFGGYTDSLWVQWESVQNERLEHSLVDAVDLIIWE